MHRLQLSLRKLMIAFTVAVCLAALGAHYWRVATRPDISYTIVVDFSETYTPPTLNSSEIATSMVQMIPNPKEQDPIRINATLANSKVRVLPYGRNAIEIVASGKSWQIEPASVELLARAAARSIAGHAMVAQVTAEVRSEVSSRGRSLVPKTILAEYDATKR